MTEQFETPAAPAMGIRWADYEGRLLLFTVQSVETGINTSFGDRDAVKAHVEVLDGPTAGEGYAETLVFGKVLKAQLAASIGKRVLGRLGKGNAKPGQNAPWRLDDPTDEDKQVALRHLNKVSVPDKPPF